MYAKQLREVAGCVSGVTGATATLSTTASIVLLPRDTCMVSVSCGGAWQLKLSPKVAGCMKSTDSGATFTDYTGQASDGRTDTVVDLSSLSTAADGDYWYVGLPCGGYGADGRNSGDFNGIYVVMVATNAGSASTLTCNKWNGAWSSLSITDGTSGSSKTLNATGAITWTAFTDGVPLELDDKKAYWLRFQTSAALDSTTTIGSVTPMQAITAAYLTANVDYTFGVSDSVCALEAVVATGTPTLNCAFWQADRA